MHLPDGGSLTSDIEPGISARIEGDGMEMVLRNLLENAFLYSPASPEVQVTLRRSGKNCTLSVTDNGRGIDAKELKNIFRMFYRVRAVGRNDTRDRARTVYRQIDRQTAQGEDNS